MSDKWNDTTSLPWTRAAARGGKSSSSGSPLRHKTLQPCIYFHSNTGQSLFSHIVSTKSYEVKKGVRHSSEESAIVKAILVRPSSFAAKCILTNATAKTRSKCGSGSPSNYVKLPCIGLIGRRSFAGFSLKEDCHRPSGGQPWGLSNTAASSLALHIRKPLVQLVPVRTSKCLLKCKVKINKKKYTLRLI